MSSRKPRNTEFSGSIRLLEAADILYAAIQKHPEGFALVDMWSGDPDVAPSDAFTSDEYIEAMFFLFRLGLAQPRRDLTR